MAAEPDAKTLSALRSLRQDALRVFYAGLKAADPAAAVRSALSSEAGRRLEAAALQRSRPLKVVAAGKAACTMAHAAAETLSRGVFPGPGIAVVNRENLRDVERFRVFSAGHPLPDVDGAHAAEEVSRYLQCAVEGDAILVLLSGGASALLPAPAPGVSLADKLEATRLLLGSGADISELNTVRKHLSTLKGGGLVRQASPARIECLILSDVIGDDLSTIASGPTAPDPTTFAGARDILVRRGLWERVPRSVCGRIEAGLRGQVEETPKPGDPVFERVRNSLVGSNRLSLEAAAREAAALGCQVEVVSTALRGEAREAGEWLAMKAAEHGPGGRSGRVALLAGGETTVTVHGQGLGGRNQELALSFALACRALPLGRPWVLLSAGTDGRDGPTDAAGAVVDPGTLERGEARGLDPRAALAQNDSYRFLEAAGDLLRTGATGTNVADLQVALVG
jgi:hydroxypyruvate reductase